MYAFSTTLSSGLYITEQCFKELIKEFYATFEFHGAYVVFRFRGVLRRLTMPEFWVALNLRTVEEQMTNIYTIAVQDFKEDISVY